MDRVEPMNVPALLLAVAGGALCWLALELFLRVIVPWRATRMVNRIIRDVRSGKPSPPRDFHFAITFDPAGFTVSSLKKPAVSPLKMNWAEIERVCAFKRDLMTYDCICLLLADSDGRGLELDEEMAGWIEFVEGLPTYLPGGKPFSEWVWTVGSPAFETNLTEIFSR